jgi:hypothetical protein
VRSERLTSEVHESQRREDVKVALAQKATLNYGVNYTDCIVLYIAFVVVGVRWKLFHAWVNFLLDVGHEGRSREID